MIVRCIRASLPRCGEISDANATTDQPEGAKLEACSVDPDSLDAHGLVRGLSVGRWTSVTFARRTPIDRLRPGRSPRDHIGPTCLADVVGVRRPLSHGADLVARNRCQQ